jgi:hypothetical protein
MRATRIFLLVLCVLLIVNISSYAGDKMVIHLKDGKQRIVEVDEIHNITFQADASPAASSGIIPGRSYRLIAKHSGMCMDVAGSGMGNSANVHQWNCHGGNNQLWKFTDKGQGNYSLTAAHSGKCLDVWGVSKDKGANVYQWDCHGGDNQTWTLIPQGVGYYMVVAKHSGKCLDVEGVSKNSGANIYQWDCHGGDNQLWKLQ